MSRARCSYHISFSHRGTHIRAHARARAHTHSCTHSHALIHTRACVHRHTRNQHTRIHTHTHSHTHAHTHVHTHTRTHSSIQQQQQQSYARTLWRSPSFSCASEKFGIDVTIVALQVEVGPTRVGCKVVFVERFEP